MKRWHVVLTKPQQEMVAAASLTDGRFDPVRLGLASPRLPETLKVGQVVAWRADRPDPPEVFAPTIRRAVPRRRNGGKARMTTVERPLFPGYVFARFDVEAGDWGWMASAIGVRGLLAHGGALVSVPEEGRGRRGDPSWRPGMADLIAAHGALGERPIEAALRPGDEVELRDAAWLGHVGRLARLDDQGRVAVLLSFLGVSREVVTTVDKVRAV